MNTALPYSLYGEPIARVADMNVFQNGNVPDDCGIILQHTFIDYVTFSAYSRFFNPPKGDYCVAVWHVRPKAALSISKH